MKKLVVFVVCILLISISCTRFVMVFSSAHMPRWENEQSITSYAQRIGLRTDNICVLQDSAALGDIMKSYGKLAEISFYDRNGFEMKVKSPEDCHITIEKVIDSLSTQTLYAVDSTRRLSDLTSRLCHLDGSPLKQDEMVAPVDFTVAIFWTTFIGNVNKRSTRVWEEKCYEKGKTLGIRVIKVNCDFQEVWESD
ncbi:MAG: hypothetical protein PHD61_02810 [Bacteroidales bacterium]|nr:hypothetical protein [Lentimicrobiaceae bacterium]MDD5694220.1 hypothetical protein [Bacteroidales bacterium]